MTPSNPDNSQPFIYRICDAAGVFHLVAPVIHNHDQSEVEGLESALSTINTTLASKANAADVQTALAGKQNTLTFDSTPTAGSTNPVTSGGVKAALNTKANANHSHDSISSDEDNSVSVSDGAVIIELNDGETGGELEIPVEKLGNLQRAINDPDSTPTTNSDNLVTSGGVKAAIDALLTNRIPIHQVAAILPKTTGHGSEQELQNWLGDGKMALVLQTARPVTVSIEALGVDDSPEGTWSGSTDFSFDLGQGIRTVKNIYDLMYAQLEYDYPGEFIGSITNWKISIYAKDTVGKDTACLINFYNPTGAE